MARRKKRKLPKPPKVPVLPGGKALRGRPRRDGMPPIQKVALLTPEQAQERARRMASAALIARIKHCAGRGLSPKFIAALVNKDFKDAMVTPEDFEPKGRYYALAVEGQAETALEVADALVMRAKDGTGKNIDALFFLKSKADFAETPAAREKAKKADQDDTISGIDVTVTD